MIRATAEGFSHQLENNGFAHSHLISATGEHEIVISSLFFNGDQLRSLLQVLTTAGATMTLEGGRARIV